MERKLNFTFTWCPRAGKLTTKRTGRFFVSPKFCTVYNNRFFKWCLICYPNGLPEKTNENLLIGGAEIVEGAVVFLQMLPLSDVRKASLKATVDVKVEVKLQNQTNLKDERLGHVFRPNDCLEACKKGDPSPYLQSALKLNRNISTVSNSLIFVSERRMQIICHIQIEIASFFYGRLFIPDMPPDTITVGDVSTEPKQKKKRQVFESDFEAISTFDLEAEVAKMDLSPDIVLVSRDGKEFMCHSSKLGQNEFFTRLFDKEYNFEESKTRRAVLDDTSSDVLIEFLHFMYKGKLSQSVKNGNLAEGLLLVAEKYLINDLKRMCVLLLIDSLDRSNAVNRLHLGQTYRAPQLLESALQVVTMHIEWILANPTCRQMLADEPDLKDLLMIKLAERASNAYGYVAVY